MKHIMLVEDNLLFAENFAWLLEALPNLQIEVLTVGSLAEARERLAEGGIDAALVDLELPDGEGASLIREMSSAVPRVPSVALTAHVDRDRSAEVRRAGAEGLVDKLGSMEEIAGAIERLLYE